MKKVFYQCICAVGLVLSSLSTFAFQQVELVDDARSQIWQTLYYDPAYTALKYPMGDVPIIKGVCTDVVIRALRHQGIDLQQRIHEDMQKNFKQYPQKWGLKGTDKNIDHRRVPNIMKYFERQGYATKDQQYLLGDIVTWDLGKGLTHIGIISDKTSMLSKTPLVIHNIGYGTRENDILHEYKIIGHFRLPHSLK
ncbi:DUF1287 domain-containing protein [Acinetobacter sp. ANC 3832]|uniref:DUF1287 domain-containing protein n=1 Tax=Acinetobacter sp. ANC 3832 TaxID=1977874 RepID=UPI000A33D8A5|nr:DUF1287 domain-containing protein [Acinetobacter sp. ANC 3832]OTG86575.1 NADH:ubiquinone oxidoreductase, Na [Acinetobacter sp. ANC 3832]